MLPRGLAALRETFLAGGHLPRLDKLLLGREGVLSAVGIQQPHPKQLGRSIMRRIGLLQVGYITLVRV
jgi:hypothetical protein